MFRSHTCGWLGWMTMLEVGTTNTIGASAGYLQEEQNLLASFPSSNTHAVIKILQAIHPTLAGFLSR